MSGLNKNISWIFGGIVFIISLGIYIKTLSPSVGFVDSGELTVVSYTLGIAHPTGYPLYTLLGRLFTFLPVGSIAWRMNLASAIFASLSVLVLYYLSLYLFTGLHSVLQSNQKREEGRGTATCLPAGRLPTATAPSSHVIDSEVAQTRGELSRMVAAFITSLLFAFSSTLWSQAVVAEVYSLTVLLSVILIFLIFRITIYNSPITEVILFPFLFGLALGNHMTICFLLCFFLLSRSHNLSLPSNSIGSKSRSELGRTKDMDDLSMAYLRETIQGVVSKKPSCTTP
jgi:hypothetical protein